MISKLISVFLIFSILSQQQPCSAFFLDAYGLVTSTVGLGINIRDLLKSASTEIKSVDETLHLLEHMNTNMNYNLEAILKKLENLPKLIDLDAKARELKRNVFHIQESLKDAVRRHRRHYAGDDAVTMNQNRYETFIQNNNVDEKIRDIHNILDGNFMNNLMKFNNPGETGKSQLQILDHLLGNVKIATAQYFTVKRLMLQFAALAVRENIKKETRNLIEDVSADYRMLVNNFKGTMMNATREIYTGDAPVKDYKRYIHTPGGPIYELNIFQKYILNEIQYNSNCRMSMCGGDKNLTECRSRGRNDNKFCPKFRLCKNKLVGCQQRHKRFDNSTEVCLNKNPNGIARYLSLERNGQPLWCPEDKGDPQQITAVTRLHISPMFSDFSDRCNYCECICLENDYYISTLPVRTDVNKNKVVTGAKLVMHNNTLYIQIKEGKLLANGSISEVRWEGLDYSNPDARMKISWYTMRGIDLTETILPNDRVITGFSFVPTQNTRDRISLAVYSTRLDFRSGVLSPHDKHLPHIPKPATSELNLSNRDVPTRSKQANTIDSNNNQYIKFTITSDSKDGGQSTVPFIDGQEVVTTTPSPLSGAGLIHKGQQGYGGFLALRVYTYNIVPYIVDHLEFNEIADNFYDNLYQDTHKDNKTN